MHGLTAEIVVPCVLMVGAAIAIVIIAGLDLMSERKARHKAEEGMVWWAGRFLRLATEIITEQGYKIDVNPDGKITLTKKEELSDLKKPRKEAPAGDSQSPQSESSWRVQSYYPSHQYRTGKNP
jgi:hypothetical protein